MALSGLINSGTSAINVFQKGAEVAGDNIANMNTPGFKSSQVAFATTFSNTLKGAEPSSPTSSNRPPIQIGGGVKLSNIAKSFTTGGVMQTGRQSDLAIKRENAFFKVKDTGENNFFATRAGDFSRDDNFYLVTGGSRMRIQGDTGGNILFAVTVDANGNKVYTPSTSAPTTTGDIRILEPTFTVAGGNLTNGTSGAYTDAQIEAEAPTSVGWNFDDKGRVNVTLSNGSSFVSSQIRVIGFSDSESLTREADNLFSGFESAGQIGGVNGYLSTSVRWFEPRALETSNTDLTREFTNLLINQRGFQASARLISVADEILRDMNNIGR